MVGIGTINGILSSQEERHPRILMNAINYYSSKYSTIRIVNINKKK